MWKKLQFGDEGRCHVPMIDFSFEFSSIFFEEKIGKIDKK